MTKLEAMKRKQYAKDYLLVASLVHYWRKKKPDNDELKALSMSVVDMHKYVQGLEADIDAYREITE